MNLPAFGVKRPVTNLMIFCAVLIIALYSFTQLGIDLFPEIEPPIISVISSYPGASPEDVEIKVTEELENQLATTPGLEKITSFSSDGLSVITLKFLWGTNIDEASNDIRDRIELSKRLLPDIPDEMENPFIFKFNTSNFPIVVLGFTADQSYLGLHDLIDKRVGDALKQLPGVGTVQFQGGGLERQINVWVDRKRLEGYHGSILDLKNKIRLENVTQPVGNLKTGLTDYFIRLPGEFESPEALNSVILSKYNNNYVYLRDVARVEDGFKEVTTLVRINEKPGLIMMVQKQSGTNTVEVAERVKKRLKELEKTLPRDVKMTVVFDTSKDIIDSVNSLRSSVWMAIVFVILVVWFFLRQFVASMIIALTIPFSLLVTFIYLFLSGKTINVISLASVAIASGMVVDNAIVVVDNVYRRLERGERPKEAAIFGTREMYLAIAASTLTTVVVFIPMLFIKGVVGIMFGELAVIIIVTLVASLFTASTFSPMLCSQWLGSVSQQKKKKRFFQRFYDLSENWFKKCEDFYAKMLFWALHHKKLIILGFLGAFLATFLLLPFVGNEFIPEEDTGDVRMNVYLPIGTRVEETDKVAKKIEKIFKEEVPEVLYSYVRSGQVTGVGRSMGNVSGSYIVAAGLKMVPKTQRKRSVKEVGQIVRNRIKAIPGVIKTDITTGNPLSSMIIGGSGKSIQLEIIGNSFKETDAFADQVKKILEKIPGAVDVSVSREPNRPELRIDVNREKSTALGLNMNAVTDTIRTYLQGYTASKYREAGRTYDIYVRLEEDSRKSLEDIENLPIVAPFDPNENPYFLNWVPGQEIRLSTIAKITETAVPEEIERLNRERVVRVECNAYGRSTGKIVEDLKKEMTKVTVPPDILINYGGEAEEQVKAFRDLALLFLLGAFLVYMVMAAQFESLLDPFIIMFAVPFTFIGVILGFLVSRVTLSVLSFLGLVMLTGIVVNNAIVLISYINILRARGLPMMEAVTAAGKERLRPILMTTITTLAGLAPLAFSTGEGSESWQPIGVTMLGGLTVSTAITLLFVPTLYAIFEERLKRRKEAKLSKAGAK